MVYFFFCKQKTAYEMRISDWSSDVCSSDLRQRAIASHRRPAIVQHLHVGATGVDHRLDREEHAGFQDHAGAGPPDMDDVGRVVEHAAKAVTAEIAYHAITVFFGVLLDGINDNAHGLARL